VFALALLCATTVNPPKVEAKQMTVFSCHDPAGNAVGHDGWSTGRTADLDMYLLDTCAAANQGAMTLELAANGVGYPDSARTEWTFFAPAWATIATYQLQVADAYAAPGRSGIGSGQAFIRASDESDPNYDYRNLGAGSSSPGVIRRTPPAPDRYVTFNASCDGFSGPCTTNTLVSRIEVAQTTIVLNDSTSPTVTNLAGPLVTPVPVRGTGEASFDAAESGPGIYSAQLTLDGHAQPAEVLNTNNGWCVNLGQTTDGTRSFSHPDPCPASTSGAVTLDTTAVPDGTHALKLTVDDAAGDSTTAFNGTLTTHNAPLNTLAPTLSGVSGPRPGTTLTSSRGSWSAPPGAGAVAYGYEWEDCDTQGNNCQAIPSADGPSYTANAADVGHTLRVLVSATDNDGLTGAESVPTGAVQLGATAVEGPGAANGNGASNEAHLLLTGPGVLWSTFAKRALNVKGRLQDSHGHPISAATLMIEEQAAGTPQRNIGQAVTAPDGTFDAAVAAGPSRVITVSYRAHSGDIVPAAQAQIRQSVRAGVRLQVTPRRTTPDGVITITGRVGGPVPPQGVVVGLFVHYRGQWQPFRTPRTDRAGRFKVTYQFQGASGRFPFRAEVFAGQASYPYAHGTSTAITVATG
jgi:hypothetical protein